jgi:hypothetical protein
MPVEFLYGCRRSPISMARRRITSTVRMPRALRRSLCVSRPTQVFKLGSYVVASSLILCLSVHTILYASPFKLLTTARPSHAQAGDMR